MKNTKGYCANNDRYGNVRSWTGGELGARVETSALACAVIACELDESERARIYLQDMRTSKHTLGSMVTAGRVLGGGTAMAKSMVMRTAVIALAVLLARAGLSPLPANHNTFPRTTNNSHYSVTDHVLTS